MASKKIISIIFLLVLVFPLSHASGESRDYLLVDLQFNFKNQKFSVLKIEQRIFESLDIFEYEDPAFTLSLVRQGRVISSARFPIPEQQNYSAINEEGVHIDVGYSDIEAINVMLAVAEPLEFTDRLEISDGTNTIFSQALNSIPIEVLSATQPLMPETGQPEAELGEPQTKRLDIRIILGAGVAFIIILELFKRFRGSRQKPEDSIEPPL